MTYVQSFSAVTPPPRYDAVAWTDLEIWESATEAGAFLLIDTQGIAVDATPATPNTVMVTTTEAALAEGWYKFRFLDAAPNYSNFTEPVLAPAGSDGAAYFTVAELRAKYAALADTGKYPDAMVASAITRAEETIEKACDVAFVPRERTAMIALPSRGILALPNNRVREVTAVSGPDTGVIDVDDTRLLAGSYLSYSFWPTSETITVTYTHGHDEPPVQVRDAAMLLARQLLLKGPIDDRATQIPVEGGGVVNLSTPGLFGAETGIPDVDAVIRRYTERGALA